MEKKRCFDVGHSPFTWSYLSPLGMKHHLTMQESWIAEIISLEILRSMLKTPHMNRLQQSLNVTEPIRIR